MFLSRKSVDATKGPLVKLIIAFAIPLIISTLVQSFFNAVDLAVLGAMTEDSSAVASVGATTSIIHLIVNTFVGLSSGAKIIIARQIGMKETDSIKKTASTSLITAVSIGFVVAIVGFIFAPDFMHLVNCPSKCFDGAVIYLRIYFLGAPAILLYNYASAIITTSGDTQRPLYYIIAGGILNAVLNVILCLILPKKVIAVAVATIAAQTLGAFLAVRRLSVMEGDCRLDLRNLSFSPSAFKKILRYGAPISLSAMLYPLANLQIQSSINSFGVAATAGNSAASTIDAIPSAFGVSFGSAASVFVGQNLGANNKQRVRQSFSLCILFGVLSTALLGSFIYSTGEFWLSIIVKKDTEAISYGMIRMFYITLFYFVAAANQSLSHTIQAYGHPAASTIISAVGVLLFRVIWMKLIYPRYQTFDNLMLCFLVSWLTVMAANILTLSIITAKYKKGIYKKI